MAKVLLVGDPDQVASCAEALAACELDVVTCSARDAAARARELSPAVIAVTPFAEDALAPRFMTHLAGALRELCPPVVLAVRADPQARDACLIAGAADVGAGGGSEAFAARVEVVANGWLRRGPRQQLGRSVMAQRARETIELAAVDLDHTGIGLAGTDGVSPGQLLRLTLPLPGGAEMLVWGRVARADDGPGVRFVGLSPDEQTAMVSALQSRSAPTPRPTSPPAASAAHPQSKATPVAPLPPPSVSQKAGTPIAPRPPPLTQPPPTPVPTSPAVVPPSEPSAPAEVSAAEIEAVPNDSEEAPPSAPARPVSLGAAIDELLDEEVPAPVEAAAEGDVLASLLDTALEYRWPETTWSTEACLEILQPAAAMGLAGEVEGAPDGELVLAFLKTVSPLEKRVFDPEPPAELPPPEVSGRCLALRLRMFALAADAKDRLSQPNARFVVDEAALQSLKAEVDQAGAQVQEMVNALMAAGQAKAIRDVSAFANALNKAWSEVKLSVSRLRGEQLGPQERAVLLDVAEDVPGEGSALRRPLPKLPEKLEAKKPDNVPIGGRVLTPVQRARRRMLVWAAVGVVALVLKFLTLEPTTQRLDGASLGMKGVIEVAIPPGATDKARALAATIYVTDTWQPDEATLARAKDLLRKRGVTRFTVMTQSRALLAIGNTGPADRVRLWNPER